MSDNLFHVGARGVDGGSAAVQSDSNRRASGTDSQVESVRVAHSEPLSCSGWWKKVKASNNSKSLLLGALTLLGLTFIAYCPLLPGSFIMDDHKLIADDNPVVNGTMGPLSIWFRLDFPLSTFVFWIQWLLFGEHAAGYHVVNIVLHALSSFLVWRLLVRLRVLGAWLAAAIFGLHPVCVASVGRIAELKNTLSLPFFLLSFLAYLRYEAICATSRKGPDVALGNMWPRAFWYTLSLCSFVLALLSKTSVLMLPVVLLACAWWQRGRISRLDLVQTSPFLVLSLAFGLMTAWFQKYQALTGLTVEHHTFLERLILAERVFWFYLEKAFIPTNLNVVYPKWRIDGTSIISHAPALTLVALAIICWHFRHTRARHALFGIVCFAVTLFPALGFFDSQFLTMWQVSDHLQYLPLIAAAALIGAGLTSGLGHRSRAASARDRWPR